MILAKEFCLNLVRFDVPTITLIDVNKYFMPIEMDYLVMDDFLWDKKHQAEFHDEVDWREEFELD